MLKQVFLKIVLFFYRVSGLRALVEWLDSKITNYRLRLNIVPVSYKLFLVLLGGAIGYAWPQAVQEYATIAKNEPVMVFVQEKAVNVAKASEKPVEVKNEWKKAWVTAYTASTNETDGSPLVMASQKMVYIGAIACPRDIPLGVQVEIKGHGVYTCEDRKAKKHDGEFDIFMLTKKEALEFGRKFLEYRLIQ